MTRTLLLLPLLGLLTLPALGQQGLTLPNQASTGRSIPGEGGDAQLPAGFQEVRWGATGEILEVLRGPLEKRPTMADDVEVFIEAAAPGEPPKNIIHYTAWRDQLVQLQVFYQHKLVGDEAHAFLDRVEGEYGPGEHVVRRGPSSSNGRQGPVLEESWTWQDPFTDQILIRDAATNEWSMLRRSRVIEELQKATADRERGQSSGSKLDEMPID